MEEGLWTVLLQWSILTAIETDIATVRFCCQSSLLGMNGTPNSTLSIDAVCESACIFSDSANSNKDNDDEFFLYIT